MGHDLYFQARIKEKNTGRVISCGDNDDYEEKDAKGFFDICWWCGSPECDVRIKMIEICNCYGGTGYTDSDLMISVPPSALRAIYAHIVNCCYVPEDKPFQNIPYETEWMDLYERNIYEKTNLLNAEKIHDLIAALDELKYEKKALRFCFLFQEHIPKESDLRDFENSPLDYEWEFRIWNSY